MQVHPEGESRFPTLEPEWDEMVLEEARGRAEALLAHSGSRGIHQSPELLHEQLHWPLAGITATHWETGVQV